MPLEPVFTRLPRGVPHFIDEPMNGLDNDGVMEMRKLFINLREEGTMIIIASHNKEDIEVLCDEVFEMEKGKLTPVQH